jgi:hypothetical protein
MRRLAVLVLVFLGGCAMPATVVRTPETRPSLAVEGAPPKSVLFVDGLAVGDPNEYDGRPNVLRLEPGTHRIAVVDAAGKVVYEQKIFVESELKTIQVR